MMSAVYVGFVIFDLPKSFSPFSDTRNTEMNQKSLMQLEFQIETGQYRKWCLECLVRNYKVMQTARVKQRHENESNVTLNKYSAWWENGRICNPEYIT